MILNRWCCLHTICIRLTSKQTNRLTLLPLELQTDITTFRAALAAKMLSCVNTFYYSNTLVKYYFTIETNKRLFELVLTDPWTDRQTY